MKIVGGVPGWGHEFEDMVAKLAKKPALYYKLLKTWRTTGYFTNNLLLSKLAFDEQKKIADLAKTAAKTSKVYVEAEPLDLLKILPKYVGVEVDKAAYIGRGVGDHCMLLLKGRNREVLVEHKLFKTLQKRHKTARWFFGTGEEYWSKPLLLLESSGLFGGELLGMLYPIPLGTEEINKVPCSDPTADRKKLVKSMGVFRYVPVKKEQEDED